MTAIACDLDGVVTNFALAFSQQARFLDNRAPIVDYDDVESWDWHTWYMKGHPEASRIIEDTWRYIRSNRHSTFWQTPIPLYSLETLQEVYRTWPVVFVSRRDGGWAYQDTIAWLVKHGVSEPLLYLCRSGEEKHEICAKLGISTIIDDNSAVAKKCLDNDMNVVLVHYRYNLAPELRPYERTGRLVRVASLRTALSAARAM